MIFLKGHAIAYIYMYNVHMYMCVCMYLHVHVCVSMCISSYCMSAHCRGLLLRYFFNGTSQRCEQFQYGGCDGNANNFQSVEECRARCSGMHGNVYMQD